MLLTAVFFLSLSSLTFEVLLARIFSISQWNHLSFMVISIALFGFAASGVTLSILDAGKKDWEKRLSSTHAVSVFIILYSATAIASFMTVNSMPMDYFRLPLEPLQLLYLLVAFLLLSLPFFFTGLIVSLAYIFWPGKTGYIYFASMAGSALGALLPVPFLPALGEGKLIILSSLIPLVLIPFGGKTKSRKTLRPSRFQSNQKQMLLSTTALGIAIAAAALVMYQRGSAIEVKMSPYKTLSQTLQFPGTRIVETKSTLRGRIDRVESPFIRFAPGLSLKFTDQLPPQWGVFNDGNNLIAFYGLRSPEDAAFARHMLSFTGYHLAPDPEKVLVIQQGGGSGIPCAISSGAQEIFIVEQHPQIAQWIQTHYRLNPIHENPRVFLARSTQKFQVIQVENWGASLPGSAALNQEHSLTVEAFKAYYNHLDEQGVLIISRKLLLPPADSIRLCATALKALQSLGIDNPQHHIGVLRSWDVFTLLMTKNPIHTETIKHAAREGNFDIVYLPGSDRKTANRFNVFDEPYHFLEMERLIGAFLSGTGHDYFQSYLLDVAPQTDSRAFPGRLIKWTRIKDIYQSTGSRLYSLLMSAELIVVVVFMEALFVSFLLLILPLYVSRPTQRIRPRFFQIVYFLSIGAGFMFVELYYIKAYTLLFGNPVISFTVVLSGMLIFSGAGGCYAQRLTPAGFRWYLILLIAWLFVVCLCLNTIIHKILGLSDVMRYLTAILLLLPSGFLIGLPFPVGMRYFLTSSGERAYAWAANGCASVLAAILSAQIAMSLGHPIIMACAAVMYLVTLWSTPAQGVTTRS